MVKKILTTSILISSFFLSFGQGVTSTEDDINDKKSLRYVVEKWDGFSEIQLDVDVIQLREDLVIPHGMKIISSDGRKTTIKGKADGYQHILLAGPKPQSNAMGPTTFKGITFTEFGNTPLYFVESGRSLTVEDCIFTKNTMLPANGDPKVDPKNNEGNADEGRAGAIGVGNNGFRGHTINEVIIKNTSFIDNKGMGYGAIFLPGGTLTVENGTFENNTALKYEYSINSEVKEDFVKGFGGAITREGGVVDIKKTTFRGQEAALEGGVLYQGKNGEIIIEECNFFGGKSQEKGGAICAYESEATIRRSYFTGNTSKTGGVLCTEGGVFLKLYNNTISENGVTTLPEKGGVIYSFSRAKLSQGSNIDIAFNTIISNKVTEIDSETNPNPAIIEIYNGSNVKFTANIIGINVNRDLFVNTDFTMYGGNFIEKVISTTDYVEPMPNFINEKFTRTGTGLTSLSAKLIDGQYVIPFDPCGNHINAINVLERNVEDGLPAKDQLGNNRAVYTKNGRFFSDAGAFERQSTKMTSTSPTDTLVVTNDTISPFSTSTFNFDCNAKIISATFELTNVTGNGSVGLRGGLKILDTLSYDSTNSSRFASIARTIKIEVKNKELTSTYFNNMLKKDFVFIDPNRNTRTSKRISYTITNNAGDILRGSVIYKYPNLPENTRLSTRSSGVNDTVTITGKHLEVVEKIRFKERANEEESKTSSVDQARLTALLLPYTLSNIIKVNVNNENDTIQFVVPGLKSLLPENKIFDLDLITPHDEASTLFGFNVELPLIPTASEIKGHVGDTVSITTQYSGGTNDVTIGGTSLPIDQFEIGNKGGWFIMPNVPNNSVMRITNPAGESNPFPSVLVAADDIQDFKLADASQSPFCKENTVKLQFQPVGSYQSPRDSVLLYGELPASGFEMIQSYHVANPQTVNSIDFVADKNYTRLMLVQKDNFNSADTIQIEVIDKPVITISDFENESCEDDEDGSFKISISGTAGVAYTTTVNTDTVTNFTLSALQAKDYVITSGVNGCNAEETVTVAPGNQKETLNYSVNAPVSACQGTAKYKFNVHNIMTSSIDNVQWEWEWENNTLEAGFRDTITPFTPFVEDVDSLTMITTLTGKGCYVTNPVIVRTKLPYIEEPRIQKESSLSTIDSYICDDKELHNVTFTTTTKEPFELFYSYGDIFSGTNEGLDTYTYSKGSETSFVLSFKHKEAVGQFSSFDGKQDSIRFKGCVFGDDGMSTSNGFNLNLTLVPTVELPITAEDEKCANANDGKVSLSNPDSHILRWYEGTAIASNSAPIPNTNDSTKLENLKPGDYTLVVRDKDAQCADTTAFKIKEVPKEDVSYDIVSEKLCEGQRYQFKLNNIVTGNIQSIDWKIGTLSVNNPTNPADTLSGETTITRQMADDTLFVTMIVEECNVDVPYKDTLPLSLVLNPNVKLQAEQSNSITACDGDDFNAKFKLDSINAILMYQLEDVQNILTQKIVEFNDSIVTVTTPFADGIQKITLDSISIEGCTFNVSGDTVTKLVGHNQPVVTITQTKNESCENKNDGVLSAKITGGQLQWLFLGDALSSRDTIDNLSDGLYKAFASYGDECPSDTVEVTILEGDKNDTVKFELELNDKVCLNESFEMKVKSFEGKGTFTWVYNQDTIQLNSDTSYRFQQPVSVTSRDEYIVYMTNDAKCKANDFAKKEGAVTTLPVPDKAIIDGNNSPNCSSSPVYTVINKTASDSIIWVLSNTSLDIDEHNGDSLTINQLERSVLLSAKIESDLGCVGDLSDVFEVKPIGCDLQAEFAISQDQVTGDKNDTICNASTLIVKNISTGDYDSASWKLNDTEISTALDSLKYDFSNNEPGVYDLELTVTFDDVNTSTIKVSKAITVIDDLPNQTITGNAYNCFGTESVYNLNTKGLNVAQIQWTSQRGTIRDSVFSGDSSLSVYSPEAIMNLDTIQVTVTSLCNEVKTYNKPISNFFEDLNSIQDVATCQDSTDIVIPAALVKPNYKFSFVNEDQEESIKLSNSTYRFKNDGFYNIMFEDTISNCINNDSILTVAIIPGFKLKQDIIFTDRNSVASVEIYIDSNDAKFIDESNYVLDRVSFNERVANVILNNDDKTLTYELTGELTGGIDSLYYYGRNNACTSNKAIDSAIVYIYIPTPEDDTEEIQNGETSITLSQIALLLNDVGGLDTIVFNRDETTNKTTTGFGDVDTLGKVNYPNGFPDAEFDIVRYHSCAKSDDPKYPNGYNPSSCRISRARLRIPFLEVIEEISGKDKSKNDFSLTVYNVVTPDGDGIHDNLEIILKDKKADTTYTIKEGDVSTLQIFTKWGDLVYESNNYTFENDEQTFKGVNSDGESLPNGTYYYVYDLAVGKCEDCGALDFSKKNFTESGFLILKRED